LSFDVEANYRRFGPMVLRRCRRLLRNEDQAIDAMHDVFVQVLRAEERLDESAPSALLLRIATNVCLNRLRGERRRPEDPDDELVLQIAAWGEDVEGRSLARALLDRVFGREPGTTRTIAVLYHVDRLTHEEVAREVGMSVSGVRKRLRTLRERLTAVTNREEVA
jgi:RNA polymerase sigma factor (sigma-70 family)